MSKKKTLADVQAENDAYEVKDHYDLNKMTRVGRLGKRAIPEPPPEPGKIRITIRIDEDILEWFSAEADKHGGKVGYQTLVNTALREYIEGRAPRIEDALRRIIREELRGAA